MVKLSVISIHIIFMLLAGCGPPHLPAGDSDKEPVNFGEITVCAVNSEIRFYAIVKKNEGRVQHLLYLTGYHWLKEQAAIVSDANLTELQNSFALLDWELWDELWQGIESNKTRSVKVYIEQEGKRVAAGGLVGATDSIYIGDLMFLGCPYFDAVALDIAIERDCGSCPVFPLEQRALQEKFVRNNGESGYMINNLEEFDIGSRVGVMIKLPYLKLNGG